MLIGLFNPYPAPLLTKLASLVEWKNNNNNNVCRFGGIKGKFSLMIIIIDRKITLTIMANLKGEINKNWKSRCQCVWWGHFWLGSHLGFVWLEGWKCGRIENSGRVEKWEDKIFFNFPHFCLVGSGKVEGWKKWVYVNLLIYPYKTKKVTSN